MGITQTYSKRKRELERAGLTEVYQYDTIPEQLRVQIIYIWKEAIGRYVVSPYPHYDAAPASNAMWQKIHDLLARELGVFNLGSTITNPYKQCQEFLQREDTDHVLDIIEMTFRWIERIISKMDAFQCQESNIKISSSAAIAEPNARFQEHAVGYQYVSGNIVRVDSEYLHAETVKPALALLHQAGFEGPAEEFLRGHEHYRNGKNKEAIAEASKSLESTLKAICKARGWIHAPNATVKPLIDLVFDNGLLPEALKQHFGGLRSAMESGLPTLSNRTSRHGQGIDTTIVASYMAAYALHLAASNIVFLVEAHSANP